jgi:hypothetical protein
LKSRRPWTVLPSWNSLMIWHPTSLRKPSLSLRKPLQTLTTRMRTLLTIQTP